MNVVPPRRTQPERRKSSEERLLQAAIDVIAHQGVGAVTFETLGKASGLSRGLVSQRFGSKQNLIEAVLRRLHDQQQLRLAEHRLDALPGLDAILAYVRLCLANIGSGVEARAYFVLLSSAMADVPDRPTAFQDTHGEVKHQLETWLRKGQGEGTIRPAVDCPSTALMIGCLLFGTSMQLLVDPDLDIASVTASILDTLDRSLAI